MLIEALSTIVMGTTQMKNKEVVVYTIIYTELWIIVEIKMKLEDITLREISQKVKGKYHMLSKICKYRGEMRAQMPYNKNKVNTITLVYNSYIYINVININNTVTMLLKP